MTGGRDNVVNVWTMKDYTLKTMIPVFESVERVVFNEDTRGFNHINVEDKGNHLSGKVGSLEQGEKRMIFKFLFCQEK